MLQYYLCRYKLPIAISLEMFNLWYHLFVEKIRITWIPSIGRKIRITWIRVSMVSGNLLVDNGLEVLKTYWLD